MGRSAQSVMHGSKSGLLYKQGHKVKNWKRRWFSLCEKRLYYFDPAHSEDSRPYGVVLLDGYIVELVDDPKLSKKLKCNINEITLFRLWHSQKPDYLLCADSEAEMEEWISAILLEQFRHEAKRLTVIQEVKPAATSSVRQRPSGGSPRPGASLSPRASPRAQPSPRPFGASGTAPTGGSHTSGHTRAPPSLKCGKCGAVALQSAPKFCRDCGHSFSAPAPGQTGAAPPLPKRVTPAPSATSSSSNSSTSTITSAPPAASQPIGRPSYLAVAAAAPSPSPVPPYKQSFKTAYTFFPSPTGSTVSPPPLPARTTATATTTTTPSGMSGSVATAGPSPRQASPTGSSSLGSGLLKPVRPAPLAPTSASAIVGGSAVSAAPPRPAAPKSGVTSGSAVTATPPPRPAAPASGMSSSAISAAPPPRPAAPASNAASGSVVSAATGQPKAPNRVSPKAKPTLLQDAKVRLSAFGGPLAPTTDPSPPVVVSAAPKAAPAASIAPTTTTPSATSSATAAAVVVKPNTGVPVPAAAPATTPAPASGAKPDQREQMRQAVQLQAAREKEMRQKVMQRMNEKQELKKQQQQQAGSAGGGSGSVPAVPSEVKAIYDKLKRIEDDLNRASDTQILKGKGAELNDALKALKDDVLRARQRHPQATGDLVERYNQLSKSVPARVNEVFAVQNSQLQGQQRPIVKTMTANCNKCGVRLEGDVVEVAGMHFHRACFGCAGCGRKLERSCLNIGDKPYCDACGKQAFIRHTLGSSGAAK